MRLVGLDYLVTLCCDGFKTAGSFTAKGEGFPNLPFATHPGHVNTTANEQVYQNAVDVMLDKVIEGLTVQPKDAKPKKEPGMRDIIFSGTYEEVNEMFLEKEWSEGLPIVPPTLGKVDEFMKFTDRKATIWSVAVNGVMSGCRPEYMPILVAIAEALSIKADGSVSSGISQDPVEFFIDEFFVVREDGSGTKQEMAKQSLKM